MSRIRIGYSVGSSLIGALLLAGSLGTANAAEIRGFGGVGDRCLDIPNANPFDGTQLVLWDCNNGSNQQWTVTNGEIRSVLAPSKCVDVKGFSRKNLTPIILWPCNNQANQQWRIEDGEVRSLGKCMDVTGEVNANGVPIILFKCHGSANQNWEIE